MKKLPVLSAFLSIAALAISGAALANEPARDGGAEFRIGIAGKVPVICRVSLDTTVLADVDGRVSLGTMKEFCNNPTGYRVVLEYPAAMESAKLIIDGREFALDGSGLVDVTRSAGAAVAEHKVELDLNQKVGSGALALRIDPL